MKLKSAVCDTEVLLVKAPQAGTLSCGGAPMVAERGEKGDIDPAFAEGTKMGKRYTDAAGTLEVLCIKPGAGSLAFDGAALQLKDAKPLPSSD
ncbi:hypothetical protein [Acidocella sp.]|uniref:hypothetical protein n=1 Tax=Acidocella sp. TaxID=50710 RepID=UPI002605C80B|nr:hypothetical protein [Acidocella sp.]